MTKKKTVSKKPNGAASKANGAAKKTSPAAKKAPAAKKTVKEPQVAQTQATEIDPEMAKKLANLRSTLRETFGKAVMAMIMVPRYKSQTLGDLQHLVLDPMMQDRLAIAYPGKTEGQEGNEMAGFAIWANVSEEVDQRIREQIASGVFPIRLKTEDWNSGKINWLLDVIAPDQKTVTSVIGNFRQVIKDGELRLHPLISRLVDAETLEKMGARRDSASQQDGATA